MRLVGGDVVAISSDILFIWDVISVALCGYWCTLFFDKFLPGPRLPTDFFESALSISLIAGSLAAVVLRQRKALLMSGSAAALTKQTAVQFAALAGLVLTLSFFARLSDHVPRGFIAAWLGCGFGFVLGGRLWLFGWLRNLEAKGALRERIAIIGTPSATKDMIRNLLNGGRRSVEIVGVFEGLSLAPEGTIRLADPDLAELIELGMRRSLDRIVLALPDLNQSAVRDVVQQLKVIDIELALCPVTFCLDREPSCVDFLGQVPLFVLAPRPYRRWGIILKAAEDRILGALLLILLFPAMFVVAIAIKLDSPGPVFFRQWRQGWNNTEFRIWKFRTMTHDHGHEERNAVRQTQIADPRVTRVGRFLRRSSLDELPQLFNVLCGEMSLVGPRPHSAYMRTENLLGEEIVQEYAHRHRVKPGMTGWAQVNGLRGATHKIEQMRKRVELDIYYIEHWSILFDLKILFLTPLKLLFDGTNAY